MKFLMLAALLLSSLAMPAFGAETSIRCANADGSVRIIDGKFYAGEELVAYPYVSIYQRRLVHSERKHCRLARAGRDVIAYDLRVFKEHIIYTHLDTREADLRCEEETRAIPAGDSCAE